MRLLITGGSGFIGTHVARKATEDSTDWLNLDVRRPVSGEGAERWERVDILDQEGLQNAFTRFRPTHVLHLAARTDTEARSLSGYRVNTVGTLNVLAASAALPSLRRFVFVSTQFVVRPGAVPQSDLDFEPHTAYGESKVIGELLTRSSLSDLSWVIVRPTNVWGPWHPRYPTEFWRVLARHLYFHPARTETWRTYGYVTNVAHQILSALLLPTEVVAGRVFYLGDPPIRLKDWVDAFSCEMLGHPTRTVPARALRLLALVGDAAEKCGVRAPLTSTRFQSMTENYITPTAESIGVLGTSGMSVADGVRETVEWLRMHSPTWSDA
jgi:nucleoside-diphosphate-sugar epimerase